jgi:hypothetical protein
VRRLSSRYRVDVLIETRRYLDYNETVQALAAGGFQFSPPVMQLLVKRFQSPDRPGQLSFEGFIQLSAFVGQMKFELHCLSMVA